MGSRALSSQPDSRRRSGAGGRSCRPGRPGQPHRSPRVPERQSRRLGAPHPGLEGGAGPGAPGKHPDQGGGFIRLWKWFWGNPFVSPDAFSWRRQESSRSSSRVWLPSPTPGPQRPARPWVTHCTQSVARPLFWYSTMHRISWSFSSSSCGTDTVTARPGRLCPKRAGRARSRPSPGPIPGPVPAPRGSPAAACPGSPRPPRAAARARTPRTWRPRLRAPAPPPGRACAAAAAGSAPSPAPPARATKERRRAACTQQFILVWNKKTESLGGRAGPTQGLSTPGRGSRPGYLQLEHLRQ